MFTSTMIGSTQAVDLAAGLTVPFAAIVNVSFMAQRHYVGRQWLLSCQRRARSVLRHWVARGRHAKVANGSAVRGDK
jgi:hypothetical protein